VKKRKKGKQSKQKEKNKKIERPPQSPRGKREPIRLGEGVLRHSFSLARKPSGLHRGCPGSYPSLIVLRIPTPSHHLSFPVPYSEFGLTLERERDRNTPVLSEKVCVVICRWRSLVFILSVLRTSAKKNRRKKQSFDTPSPPYMLSFRFHLLPATFVSCLALSFNFALLFECANP
jgi:hypothetical protein